MIKTFAGLISLCIILLKQNVARPLVDPLTIMVSLSAPTYLECICSRAEHNCEKYFQIVFSGINLFDFLKNLIIRPRSPASASSRTIFSSLFSINDARYWITLSWLSCFKRSISRIQSEFYDWDLWCFKLWIQRKLKFTSGQTCLRPNSPQVKLARGQNGGI